MKCTRKNSANIDVIKNIANKYIVLFNEKEISLMILMFFYDKYSLGQSFNTDLIAFILNLETQKSLQRQFTEKSQNAPKIFHFLLYSSKKNAFKMINYDFFKTVIDIISQKRDKDIFELFLDEYYKLIDNVLREQNDALTDPLIKATQLLFITEGTKRPELKNKSKSDEEDDAREDDGEDEETDTSSQKDEKNNFYTKLIDDIEKQFESSDQKAIVIVEEVFQTLYQKFNEANKVEIAPYFASLQARYVFHRTNSFEEKARAIEIIKTAFKINGSIKNSTQSKDIQRCDLYGAYADLMRHYVMENIKRAKNNSESNFQPAYEFAEDSVYAYTKSISLAEGNKQALPLVGECKLRKNLLFHFFNDVCKSQHEFKNRLNNNKAPEIVKKSLEILPAQLDRLERLHNHYSTGYNYNLQELYYECRIEFCELMYSTGKLKSFDQINNIPIEEDINLYRVIKGMNKDRKNDYSHKDISTRHLSMIIDRYEKQYKKKLSNFRSLLFHDLMQAYIHLANKDKNKEASNLYSLKKVLYTAKEWKRIHGDDEDAHFYVAVLELINAIQTNDQDLKRNGLRNARIGFEDCAKMYEKKYKNVGMPKRWLKKEFLLGNNECLRGLVIFDSQIDTSNLIVSKSEIEVNDRGQLFVDFNGLHLKYLTKLAFDKESEVREIERCQRKPFEYCICISRKNLLMFKYKKI